MPTANMYTMQRKRRRRVCPWPPRTPRNASAGASAHGQHANTRTREHASAGGFTVIDAVSGRPSGNPSSCARANSNRVPAEHRPTTRITRARQRRAGRLRWVHRTHRTHDATPIVPPSCVRVVHLPESIKFPHAGFEDDPSVHVHASSSTAKRHPPCLGYQKKEP